jgi:K(+)-stimulated pyrophosphate-energized sodium pump
MAADLFETYAVTVVATMVLGAIFFAGTRRRCRACCSIPWRICGACILTSIIGTFFVKLGPTARSWARSTRASSHSALLSVIGLRRRDVSSHRLGSEIGIVGGDIVDHRHEPVLSAAWPASW